MLIERVDCEQNTIRIHDQLSLRIPMNIGAADLTMLAFMTEAQKDQITNTLVPKEDMISFFEQLKK